MPYGGDLARHEHRTLGVEDDQGLDGGLQQLGRDVLDSSGVAAGQLAGDQTVPVPGGAQQQPHPGALRAADGGEVGVDVLVVDLLPGRGEGGVQFRQLRHRHEGFAFGGDGGGGVQVLLAADDGEHLHLGAAAGARPPAGGQRGHGLGGQLQRGEQLQVADGGAGMALDGVLDGEQQVDISTGRQDGTAGVGGVGERAEFLGGELRVELPYSAGEPLLDAEQQVPRGAVRCRPAGGDGGQPVALALEGVGRQVHPGGGRVTGVVAVPGDGQTVRVVAGERGESGQPQMVLDRDAAPGERGEPGLRADLDQGVPAALGDGPDAVEEADRFADVPHPVLRVADLAEPGEASGDVGDEADLRLVEGDAVEGGAEVVVDLGHQGRVEGVRDLQALDADALLGEVGDDLVEGGGGARDHGLVDGVDPGQCQVGVALQQGGDLLDGGGDRGHAALAAHGLHQPGAGRDQGDGVGQAEESGDGGGDDFADAVPEEHVRAHAPGHPLLGEGVLQGEQGGLGVLGAVDGPGVGGGAEEQLAHGAAEVLGEQPVALVHLGTEDGEGLVEGGAHAGVLGALAGEHERGLADARGSLVLLLGGPVEELFQRGAVGDGRGDAVGVVGAGGVGAVAQRSRCEAGPVVQQLPVLCGEFTQGGGVLRGQGEQRRGAALLLRPPGRLGRLLQDHRADGPGEAEAVDDGPPDVRLPGLTGRGDPHRIQVPGDAPGGGVEVDVRVDGGGAQLEHRLDDTDDAGGGLHVAQVGLDRTDQHRPVLGVGVDEHVTDGAELDGVAERGAGAVCLDVLDVLGREAGGGQRAADHLLLGGAVGHGQAGAVAVLADGGAADQGEDAVAVTLGVTEPLEDDDAAALGAGVSVGGLVEGLALPVRGEHLGVGEHHRDARVVQGVDAAAQCDVGLAAAQRLHGEVQADQRGGAGGVDAHARAAPAEEVGEPAREREHGDAGGQVAVQLLVRQRVQLQRVVDGAGADVHTAVAAAQRRRVDTGMFQGLPGGLQEQPLLGVHVAGFLRGNVEEAGVEQVDTVEEPAGRGADLALVVGALGRERLDVPAVAGDRADSAAALPEEGLELVGRAAAAGEPQTDSDDRDRLGRLL